MCSTTALPSTKTATVTQEFNPDLDILIRGMIRGRRLQLETVRVVLQPTVQASGDVVALLLVAKSPVPVVSQHECEKTVA